LIGQPRECVGSFFAIHPQHPAIFGLIAHCGARIGDG
jgi:hypothetical protein